MIELSIFLLLLINLVTSLRLHKSISISLCIDHYKTALHDSKHSPSPSKKFIVVTGGVISGIGKGITASSIGVLLKMLNVKPTAIKIDPYLNADAGTMSPFEHGEVFVLGKQIYHTCYIIYQ